MGEPDSGGQLVRLFWKSSKVPNSISDEDIVLSISSQDSWKSEMKYIDVLSALLARAWAHLEHARARMQCLHGTQEWFLYSVFGRFNPVESIVIGAFIRANC